MIILALMRIGIRETTVNSLISPDDIIGMLGTVEVPFDSKSKGKVRIKLRGSIIDLIALTDCPQKLNKGDKVFIIDLKDSRAWVIPENQLMLPEPE